MEQPEEQPQDQPQELPSITVPTEEAEAEEETEPTRTVKNFWERLDDVFTQNTDMKEKFEELLQQFPSETKLTGPFKSFVFQPERITLCSNDDIQPSSSIIADSTSVSQENVLSGGHLIAETFSSFRIRLTNSLVNVKSLQLLSAVIPNAIQNLNDYELVFYYYRIPSIGVSNLGDYDPATIYNKGDIVFDGVATFYCCLVNGTVGIPPPTSSSWTFAGNNPARPNYFALTPQNINTVFLDPVNGNPADYTTAVLNNTYSRTYEDYNDLVSALNLCAQLPGQIEGAAPPGTLEFAYDTQLNKIQIIPDAAQIAAGYYFLPAGYNDPNIPIFINTLSIIEDVKANYKQGYTLNLRCGYTWNGLFNDAFTVNPYLLNTTQNVKTTVYWYMRPSDPIYGVTVMQQNLITANSYPDLVNTSCIRIYCDVTLSSTDDSLGTKGLLSIVPVNTNNLGVAFYQNNFNNELTKIPQIISEIGITMLNDQGQPFYLPNSATVLLELGITYH